MLCVLTRRYFNEFSQIMLLKEIGKRSVPEKKTHQEQWCKLYLCFCLLYYQFNMI